MKLKFIYHLKNSKIRNKIITAKQRELENFIKFPAFDFGFENLNYLILYL